MSVIDEQYDQITEHAFMCFNSKLCYYLDNAIISIFKMGFTNNIQPLPKKNLSFKKTKITFV